MTSLPASQPKPGASVTDLTTMGAATPLEAVFGHPDFVPDPVPDAIAIGGMPTHEELAALVFALSLRITALEQRQPDAGRDTA